MDEKSLKQINEHKKQRCGIIYHPAGKNESSSAHTSFSRTLSETFFSFAYFNLTVRLGPNIEMYSLLISSEKVL